MTFREALQSEINLQGLSVAQIAEASNVSKGAIYNILNGTTEDDRIRPGTRKALAQACDRDVVPEGEGVTFVERGAETFQQVVREATDAFVVSWMADRSFLPDRHVGQAFDWLHRMEQDGRHQGLQVIDRVFQKRSDFLALSFHNKGAIVASRIDLGLRVHYPSSATEQTFQVIVAETVLPGKSLEVSVFVCAGSAYTMSVAHAEIATPDGQALVPVIPDSFSFPGA